MTTALTQAAQAIPAYCTSGHGVHTPQQLATCLKAGWQEPTTGAVTLGHAVGGNFLPVLIVALVILAVIAGMRRAGRNHNAALAGKN